MSSAAYLRLHPMPLKKELQSLKLRPHSLFFNAILSDAKGSLVLPITMKDESRILKLVRSALPVLDHTGEALSFARVVRD